MVKKIKSIGNLAVFKGFEWDKEVLNESGKPCDFKEINIIYGRNYSGKTTLSRIFRAMETGELSDKFESPSFGVTFSDSTSATQTALTSHGKKFRVFNEDFVRDNLRFITNPDDSIEPFAILGDDNNKIEKEIEALEAELGSKEVGKETGLYAEMLKANAACQNATQEHNVANAKLEKQLSAKATDRTIGIKYKPERFGDQNYTIQKLKAEIVKVQDESYETPTGDQLVQYNTLISEITLQTIPPFHPPSLNIISLSNETEILLTKKISESGKIEELVKDAVLNRWVNEGRPHHKGRRDNCAFCENPISEERWAKLEKHFDEESEQLEKNICALIDRIEKEKNTAASALSIDKDLFYSKFHKRLDDLDIVLKVAVGKYIQSLDVLSTCLLARKKDILNPKSFERPEDTSADLVTAWNSYESIRSESDRFSNSLGTEQTKAKESLRLKEVSDYLIAISYTDQFTSLDSLKAKHDEAEREKSRIEKDIHRKEEIITSKKRELNDEEKGAKKVNEYLNSFFGHRFLTLEAKKDEIHEKDLKRIRFEVVRDGKKAYHLSEGECRLLAFCYFLAKLEDIDTKDTKPIIWIDDPISSLDGNHIFFVYSLLNVVIVSGGRFEQLFISTHSLDFMKYLKKLKGKYLSADGKTKDYQKGYFLVVRHDKTSSIATMPKYMKQYITEFNYLFHQIHKCASIGNLDEKNYETFYNFGNNARKFFEIYLYYKYPDQGMTEETLRLFFGDEEIPAVLTDRINNEYSHLCGVFERGSTPVEVPEMQTASRLIIERLKVDRDQYTAFLKSIGEAVGEELQT